ncbi:MAG: sensor histidine kinase [Burkholderiales bacterium]|nr:sensor histidine kinase [Burkholderiales bacterium]
MAPTLAGALPARPTAPSACAFDAIRFGLSGAAAPARGDGLPVARAIRPDSDRQRDAGPEAASTLFVGMVAHELRAQLRTADALRGRIAEVSGDAEAAAGLLARLAASHRRMEATLADLLALARADAAPLARAPVDLTALAWSIVADLESADPDARVDWVIEPAMSASGAPGLLRLLLANLIGNAFKYTRRAGVPCVQFFCTAGHGGRREYHVCDNGIGFEPAEASGLFAPFHRLAGAAEYAGTGLGLAMVKRIALRHGGGVRAAGAPGCGARLTFWI